MFYVDNQTSTEKEVERWDFDAPLWDLCTFPGRLHYYAWITAPRLSFVSSACFQQAKNLRELYLRGREPAKVTDEQLLYAKRLYENGFHPDDEDYMLSAGRMSSYGLGAALTALPLFFFKNPYRITATVVGFHFIHQCFNAVVNHINRNASVPMSDAQKAVGFVSASTAATAAAVGTQRHLSLEAGHVAQKFVPFAALAVAIMVNVPLMRHNEIIDGVKVYNEDGVEIGKSRIAAIKGITETVLSRIFMFAPAGIFLPRIIQRFQTICWVRYNRWSLMPLAGLFLGGLLLPMVPVACAIFPQRCMVRASTLESYESRYFEDMNRYCKGNIPEDLYFNKGL